jgi:light-regulated signal transduction histidine kinase (bacteriophytochrome)
MDRLLYDLLHYSRLGRAPLEASPLELESVVNEVLVHLEPGIQASKARVDLKLPLAAAAAHRTTLSMVLTNLIENAMKFTDPARAPVIRIWSEKKSGRVRLFVADNGIGIDPDHHEKIFGLFERLHDNSTYPGTGVGLAIVRKGVERMGGRVGVESKAGEGSRFWLELPVVKNEPK